MAAPVTDYDSFNTQLNRQVGPGSDSEVAATLGRKLTVGGAWGEEMFSKSGSYVPAEIGAVMAHMTGLRDKVDWSTAVFTWDGPDDIIRFCQHNQTLFETVLKAVFSDSTPTGSESTSTEITVGQKASYEELEYGTEEGSRVMGGCG